MTGVQTCALPISPFDYLLLAGSFGLFFIQFLMFVRVAPAVAIAEVKQTLLHKPHGHHQQQGHHQPHAHAGSTEAAHV